MTEALTGFRSDWPLGFRYGKQVSDLHIGNQQVICQSEALLLLLYLISKCIKFRFKNLKNKSFGVTVI